MKFKNCAYNFCIECICIKKKLDIHFFTWRIRSRQSPLNRKSETRTRHRIGNFYIAYVASSISNISTMIHRKVFTRSTNPFISPRASFPREMEFFYSKDIDDSCAIPPTKYRSLGRKVKYLRANGEETLSMSLYKKRDVS